MCPNHSHTKTHFKSHQHGRFIHNASDKNIYRSFHNFPARPSVRLLQDLNPHIFHIVLFYHYLGLDGLRIEPFIVISITKYHIIWASIPSNRQGQINMKDDSNLEIKNVFNNIKPILCHYIHNYAKHRYFFFQ